MKLAKTTVAAGVLVLTAGLVACGGTSSSSAGAAGAPKDATKSAFCGSLRSLSAEATPGEIADKLASVGTPSDIDADARKGFEVFLDKVSSLPSNAKPQDLSKLQNDLTSAEQSEVVAFITYTQKECATASPSASPS